MTIVIRRGRPADAVALLDFWTLAGENDGRPTDTPEAVRRLLDHDSDSVVLAVDEGRIVGSVVAGWDGWRAHLYRLAVHPSRRRQGIAGRLLDAAEQRLADLGAGRLDAMVLDANDLGHTAWRARGYRPQQDWTRWVKPVGRES